MNVKEFYDHITKHMTAEEALLKLLEGHVKTYDKLVFNEGEEQRRRGIASTYGSVYGCYGYGLANGDSRRQ